MPLPSSYTEATLTTYMRDGVLKQTGVELDLISDADYAEAVNEVAAALGSEIAAATDMVRVRAVARREAWRLAMQQAAGEYHAEAKDAADDRQQIYAHCAAMFSQASAEVLALGPVADDDGSTIAVSMGSVAVPNKAVW